MLRALGVRRFSALSYAHKPGVATFLNDWSRAFAERVRSGAWTGATGERVRTVVNIGIGGSDLGPAMAYLALQPYVQEGLELRFVSNIDPTDLAEKTKDLDPAGRANIPTGRGPSLRSG